MDARMDMDTPTDINTATKMSAASAARTNPTTTSMNTATAWLTISNNNNNLFPERPANAVRSKAINHYLYHKCKYHKRYHSMCACFTIPECAGIELVCCLLQAFES